MGQIDLSENTTLGTFDARNAKAISAHIPENMPVDLRDCYSPLSQWEGNNKSFFPPVAGYGYRSARPTEMASVPISTILETMMLCAPYGAPAPPPSPPFCPASMQYYMVPVAVPPVSGLESIVEISDNGFRSSQLDTVNGTVADFTTPQPHVGLDAPVEIPNHVFSMMSNQTDVISPATDFAHTSWDEAEHDDADVSSEYDGSRLSASAARRRRRQRASVAHSNHYQQRDTIATPRGDSWKLPPAAKGRSQPKNNSYAYLREQLETGALDLSAAMPEIKRSVRQLTFDADGCRIVQFALQGRQEDAISLCAELHGHVRRATTSPHGNYVIQKIVELMPSSVSSFISAELLGCGTDMASHRFACRVFSRLQEHCSRDPMTIQLVDQILEDAGMLCCHNFGHHVMESVLEHGLPEHKHRIALTLWSQLFAFATDAHGPYVIDSALRHCCVEDKLMLAGAFVADRSSLLSLAEHSCGYHVVVALIKCTEQRLAVSAVMREEKYRLEASDFGRKVLQTIQWQENSSNAAKPY
jgi:hypothetical protein